MATLTKESKHPKDRMAGWHYWTIIFRCTACGKTRTEHIWGTKADAEKVERDGRVCDRCEDEGRG